MIRQHGTLLLRLCSNPCEINRCLLRFFLSLSTVGIEDSWLIREVFVLLTRYGVFKQPFVKLLCRDEKCEEIRKFH